MFLNKKYHKFQFGFSLIESLVSLFIFTVGLLGVAGMQVTNQQSVLEAMQRTEAATLAHSMMERVRLNVSPVALNIYDQAIVGDGSVAAPDNNCLEVNCTIQNMASYDLWVWENELRGLNSRSGLVAPTGCISVGDGNFVTIQVAWRGQRSTTENANNACGLGNGEYVGPDSQTGYRRSLQFSTLLTR